MMDEPTSALDPIATKRIEELVHALKVDYTIVVVTHNLAQAARLSDHTAYLDGGELIEYGPTEVVFTNPGEARSGGLCDQEGRVTEGMPRRRSPFQLQLDTLQEKLLEMAGHAEDLVAESLEALRARDVVKAESVRKADDTVDRLELEVDERVIELLALQHPMARDLRFVFMASKASNDLERIGDHAVNIAKACRPTRGPSAPTGHTPDLGDGGPGPSHARGRPCRLWSIAMPRRPPWFGPRTSGSTISGRPPSGSSCPTCSSSPGTSLPVSR